MEFGLDRKTDVITLTWLKFSDEDHLVLIRERMSEEDPGGFFDLTKGPLKKYLTEEEYHKVSLKEKSSSSPKTLCSESEI